jgi:Mycoplasma protein of unknown function, DUF285
MPLLHTASKVYKGTSAATKVYQGTNLIWPPVEAATNFVATWSSATTNTLTWTDSTTSGAVYDVYYAEAIPADWTTATKIGTGVAAGVQTFAHTKDSTAQTKTMLYYSVLARNAKGTNPTPARAVPKVRGAGDWAPITIAPSSNKAQLLHHIPSGATRDAKFTVTGGACTIDWGDGTAPTNHSAGALATHTYAYASMPSAGEIAAGRQAMATVSPQAGQTITGLSLGTPVAPTTPDTSFEVLKDASDVTLTFNIDAAVWPVSKSYPCVWLKITPKNSGTFVFTEAGVYDSDGYLFNTTPAPTAYSNTIQSDFSSGPANGFMLTSSLTGGVTYWLCAQAYPVTGVADSSMSITISGGETTAVGTNAVAALVEVSLDASTISNLSLARQETKRVNLLSKATSTGHLFDGCSSLVSVCGEVAGNLDYSFYGCASLSVFPKIITSGATSVDHLFSGCHSLLTSELSALAPDFSSVTNAGYAFAGCDNAGFTTVPSLTTSSVTSFKGMFMGCKVLTTAPISSVASGTDFTSMFQGCMALTTANIPAALTTGVGTGNGTNFSNMFYGCSNVGFTSIPAIDTSKGTNFSAMLRGCNKLTSIPALNTALGTVFYQMFYGCTVLPAMPITSVASGIDFSYMFYNCAALTTANVPAVLTSGGGTANGTNFRYMFFGCNNVGFTSIPAINTSNGTNFSFMFYAASKLTSIPALNTGLGTNFSGMFSGCTVLPTMPITSVANGTDFSDMFWGCAALTSANIPAVLTTGGGTGNGTIFSSMFYNCNNVGFTSVPLINTSKGTTFNSMFNGCNKLTSIPALNCSLGTNFSTMWSGCTVLAAVNAYGFTTAVSLAGCATSISTANINTFYTNLGTAAGAQTVTVTGLTNQAASTKTIATGKGWTVA